MRPPRRVDIVVVGGGGSGLAAAIEARRAGSEVLLLEKMDAIGGSTGRSVGSVSSSGTRHQRRDGIVDSADAHFEDLAAFAGARVMRDNPRLRRLLVDEIPATFAWLEQAGLVFSGPVIEPPHREPRMHNVLPNSRAYPWVLGRLCRRLGVQIETGVTVTRLLIDNRRVDGVECRGADGEAMTVHARQAVILASGDFSADPGLKAQHASAVAARCAAVSAGNTGDGHRLAARLGARIVNGDIVHGPILRFQASPDPSWIARLPPWRWVALGIAFGLRRLPARILRPFVMRYATTVLGPDPGLFEHGGVFVNRDGAAIDAPPGERATRLVDEPDGIGYVVMDAASAGRFRQWPHFVSTAPGVAYAYLQDYQASRPDLIAKAATAAGLATRLRMSPDALRSALGPRADGEGPFIALGPIRPYVVLTDGGLAVDDDLAVLDADDRPIAGLFAAGSAGQGGLLLFGHGHHLGWAFVSGRIAARSALRQQGGAGHLETRGNH